VLTQRDDSSSAFKCHWLGAGLECGRLPSVCVWQTTLNLEAGIQLAHACRRDNEIVAFVSVRKKRLESDAPARASIRVLQRCSVCIDACQRCSWHITCTHQRRPTLASRRVALTVRDLAGSALAGISDGHGSPRSRDSGSGRTRNQQRGRSCTPPGAPVPHPLAVAAAPGRGAGPPRAGSLVAGSGASRLPHEKGGRALFGQFRR
jgi:hypothetical protein